MDTPLKLHPSSRPSAGLYLEVSPAGNKLWRFKFHFDGKEKRLALGVYPKTGLIEARGKRDEARLLLSSAVHFVVESAGSAYGGSRVTPKMPAGIDQPKRPPATSW